MEKKILVIDDDAKVRDYLFSLFTDNGYNVQTAEDAEHGLDLARQITPDLVTLDIAMPGEWGPRFYHHLSRDPDLKGTPVVVISGLPGHEYAIQDAAACVSKPFDPDRLLQIINDILN